MATKVDRKNSADSGSGWPFGKRNYQLFSLALVVTAVGFVLLGVGDITFAPVLLVLGYCVLMPLAIIVKSGKSDPADTGLESD